MNGSKQSVHQLYAFLPPHMPSMCLLVLPLHLLVCRNMKRCHEQQALMALALTHLRRVFCPMCCFGCMSMGVLTISQRPVTMLSAVISNMCMSPWT